MQQSFFHANNYFDVLGCCGTLPLCVPCTPFKILHDLVYSWKLELATTCPNNPVNNFLIPKRFLENPEQHQQLPLTTYTSSFCCCWSCLLISFFVRLFISLHLTKVSKKTSTGHSHASGIVSSSLPPLLLLHYLLSWHPPFFTELHVKNSGIQNQKLLHYYCQHQKEKNILKKETNFARGDIQKRWWSDNKKIDTKHA